jgi:hypothetical protein
MPVLGSKVLIPPPGIPSPSLRPESSELRRCLNDTSLPIDVRITGRPSNRQSCGSRSLGGVIVGVLDELAVDEAGAGTNEWDEVGCVDRPPAVLG